MKYLNSKIGIVFFLIFLINDIRAQNWEPIVEMDNNIFPSYILATASASFKENFKPKIPQNINYVGDPMGVIGVKITEIPKNASVSIEISENDILYKSSIKETIIDSGSTYYIYPKINYKFSYLRSVSQQKPINIEFKIFINDTLKNSTIVTSNIRPLEECPYAVKDYLKNKLFGIHWMFAAYVNEDSPLINEILSKALKSGLINQFNGYQGDHENTKKQVFAIWYSLQKNGIKYSSITNTSLTSNEVYSQRVRLIEQSYGYSQANCVDGTVLFASLLKAIGIDPVLVLIPGHMFLGYYLDNDHSVISFLETTLIGSIDLNKLKKSEISAETYSKIVAAEDKLDEISGFQFFRTPTEKQQQIRAQEDYIDRLYKAAQKEASRRNFNKATDIGIEQYASLKSNFGKDNLQYQLINIEKIRRMVKPIWR